MPQEHSLLYRDCITFIRIPVVAERDGVLSVSENISPKVNAEPLVRAMSGQRGTFYTEMSDFLRETNDAHCGIVSTLVTTESGEKQWVRDATKSKPLEQRISHNDPAIESNNALLRCLSRLRPIDYAIEKLGKENSEMLRQGLNELLQILTGDILKVAQNPELSKKRQLKEIKALETQFNTVLVGVLVRAGLAEGCKTRKDAEKLLFHYRNLSSLVEPARPMVTMTYDPAAKVFQRETQYPVTQKTEKQKEALKSLYGPDVPLPALGSLPLERSMDQADRLFFEKMCSDDTCLGAQARKTHPVGVKNGFVVAVETCVLNDESVLNGDLGLIQGDSADTLVFGRMGAPAYVGDGAGSEEDMLQEQTVENLTQIQNAANAKFGEKPIHLTCLNTDQNDSRQNVIIRCLRKAFETLGGGNKLSMAPLNPLGTLSALEPAKDLFDPNAGDEAAPSGIAPLMKKTRLESAVKIMLQAVKKGLFSIINCASGQDRTGTLAEAAIQVHTRAVYKKKGLDASQLETSRAQGGNAAEITSHHVQGSAGMKSESKASNFFLSFWSFFTKKASEQFYRKSAGTNKHNRVDEAQFIVDSILHALDKLGKAASARRISAHSVGSLQDAFLHNKGSLSIKQLKKLRETLDLCTRVMNTVTADNKELLDGLEAIKVVIVKPFSKGSPAWLNIGQAVKQCVTEIKPPDQSVPENEQRVRSRGPVLGAPKLGSLSSQRQQNRDANQDSGPV